MKFLIVLMITNISLFAQSVNFNKYFVNKTMRVDYIHAGNNKSENFFLKQIKQEPYWGGSLKNLIDTFYYGKYYFEVFTIESNKLIYSRGFNTLFQEWQSYDEAKNTRKSFYETVIFPYPKQKVKLVISRHEKNGKFTPVFSLNIDPNDFMINKETPQKAKVFKIHNSGSSSKKLDIVFLFDGYTKKDSAKLHKDAKRFAGYFWSYKPFSNHKNNINIWGIETYSQDSGTDIPGDNIWVNTVFNTNFYTFRTERYLTTQDVRKVRDLAANVSYDQIYIIVNTSKYGGGGIYNFWNITASDNPLSKWVFLHEFGHGFAGLADEYIDEGTPTEEIYDKNTEPPEPNITNLVNFNKKWKNMVAENTPIPTPATEKYKNTIGVYEGAGYVAKGIYRPYQNCEMRQLKQGFCPVCTNAIIKMIKFYSE